MHLYLHIPFCKQACHYCDFHFSTSLAQKPALVEALRREIEQQQDYLGTRQLETIYFGGGTPSLLTEAELASLFETIHRHFTVAPEAEITLEANPDDLTPAHLRQLRPYVNRLSIGIQSFHEPHLRFMNRAHSALEAQQCVRLAQEAGFHNLTIDLIYGVPAADHAIWERDLETALLLDVPHISSYSLTIEPDTALGRWQKKGRFQGTDDEFAAEEFEMLIRTLGANGYEQYEISNFARPGHEARHNSSYWKRRPYLGIGPSAHSYNGHSRQYNVANNALYIKAINRGELPCTVEMLTPADQVNEYLLTGLRTKWGCQVSELESLSGGTFVREQQAILAEQQRRGWLTRTGDQLLLTPAGKFFADRVAAELFMES
ncbi:radical SAM family heme chaperone HemW [Tellurirhabdus rosea]|uniref:radical SAM family heme chaperone HemW n=1 Tax=Tellurirhabdus rosea TaxID=2674997 RepID=UPI002250854C|nr:radical SAM family heme chaperone HemW [Tellurirhabdus rosea]